MKAVIILLELKMIEESYIKDLYQYINETPRLLSLLYDIDLLPEQTMNEPIYHIKTLRIADAWRDNSKYLKRDQKCAWPGCNCINNKACTYD